ncbi:FHA domain-containing protein [Solirubrobacter ginsenosidimutans]|uniref:FHA domain-containing protein n=1 Tax=Solirubrobacter ginsenosidimutans TaxID=490573 RepID=A0A9X3MNU8_9ACTN|nr:FHA domain-containing protein [Solirubrobacter ginsenosidimutans]MDA0159904.1 FHA domain-containing protein [Solirubrobacter ginsenosidimutans]
MLELVLPDRRRVALAGELTIGRSPPSDVLLLDPTVSRVHARILVDGGAARIEDAGSSYGTWLNGRRVVAATPLVAGASIRLGDSELQVARVPRENEAGATVVVPSAYTTRVGENPRLRSGYALKRLAASEGSRRWVLKDLRSGAFVRFSSEDAALIRLLDGSRSLADLSAEAVEGFGPDGLSRLALLLASLAERGLLSGSQPRPVDPGATSAGRRALLRRLLAPRTWSWPGAGRRFARLYRPALFSPPALAVFFAVAVAGLASFVALVVARYGTPFVVARKVGLGAVVFVVGRLAIASVHETAHGLVMTHFGRPVREAGFKVVLVFPYLYVDTSDAWFEPRRRRVAVSAAGPCSDLILGGAFSLACLASAAGATRDVFFQLAFGAYLGAFFNLNPIAPRDGQQIATDLLQRRGLRVARIVWLVLGTAIGAALVVRRFV